MGIRLNLLCTLEAIGRNNLQSLEHHLYISCEPSGKRLKKALAPFPDASQLVDLNVWLIFVSNQSSRGFHSRPRYSSFGFILTQFPSLQIPSDLFFLSFSVAFFQKCSGCVRVSEGVERPKGHHGAKRRGAEGRPVIPKYSAPVSWLQDPTCRTSSHHPVCPLAGCSKSPRLQQQRLR